MKQFVAILLLTVCASLNCSAQTFLDRLQRQQKNQGKVTVTQSAAIDELVNSSAGTAPTNTPARPATPATTPSHPATTHTSATPTGTHPDSRKHTADNNKKQEHGEKATPHAKPETKPEAHKKQEDKTPEPETLTVDMRKKVMANSYKVTGYRVQAFAGGNTRADRQKAEQARNNIKRNFPDEPVYVHFYSPRWICRVGNYRSYEEAHRMLVEIRKLGYRGASIVKGKISVQY